MTGDFRLGMADIRPPAELASGLCAQMGDPDLWFVERSPAEEREAMGICGMCGVREACLEYAMGVPWLRGIWGGVTARQRDAVRRGTRTLQDAPTGHAPCRRGHDAWIVTERGHRACAECRRKGGGGQGGG